MSEHLLAELEDVLFRRKFRRYFSEEQAGRLLEDARAKGLFGEDGADDATSYTPDPEDDYLVALALTTEAAYLVSGDPHLSGLEGETLPPVVSPRGFLEILGESKADRG